MPRTLTICFEHRDFVVINKPENISVHKDNAEIGLTEMVAKQLNLPQVWLVHRLDKITSGLLILAKNNVAATIFGELFQTHQITKTYWALATNKPKKKQGTIIGDMQKARNGAWKLTLSRDNPAITQFNSRSVAPHLRHFELKPKTGKTHQLRVAMKSLSAPILGDTLYAGEKSDRVYLHAYKLQFYYQGEWIEITALPENGEKWCMV